MRQADLLCREAPLATAVASNVLRALHLSTSPAHGSTAARARDSLPLTSVEPSSLARAPPPPAAQSLAASPIAAMASSSSSSSHVVLVDHDVPHGGAAGAGWGSDGGGGGGDAGFAPLPALSSSFERGPARDAARRALMLDDSCLSTRGALEPRRYDAARVAAFYAGAALSGGTLAVFAVWYRAAAARALSSPCAPADADIVLVTPADADKGAPPDVCAV